MALVNELPSDWDSYDAGKKIAWFNNNDVSVSDLQNAGVDNGYQPPPERDYEAERIAAEQEAARIAAEQEAIRQENIRQQEIRRQQEEQARSGSTSYCLSWSSSYTLCRSSSSCYGLCRSAS